MRKRVEETLDLLGIAELRDRPLRMLSGGQQQRVAIGSVLTAHPRVLVLDEPTSALDPTAAEDVLAAMTRLVHDLGVTVMIAEHRLERVVHHCDRVVLLTDGTAIDGSPEDVLVQTPLAPPVVQLGRRRRDGRLRPSPSATRAAAWNPSAKPWPRRVTPTRGRVLEIGARCRAQGSWARRGLRPHDRGPRGRPRPPRR